MEFWDYVESDGKKDVETKEKVVEVCAKVHSMYRKKLGAVDQADVKATVQGLTAESDPKWYQNQLKFLVESAVSSCNSNYNLDETVTIPEPFTEFHNMLLSELNEKSKDYRKYNTRKRQLQKQQTTPRPLKKQKFSPMRHRLAHQFGNASRAGVTCPGRDNLAAYIRKSSDRRRCQFCGKRSRSMYQCIGCNSFFCMEAPTHIDNPKSDSPRAFRRDGPFCWHLIHGFSTWSAFK